MTDQPMPMYCLDCQYQLNGLPGRQCPECGRNFSASVRSSFSPLPMRTDVFTYLGNRLPKIMVTLGLANTIILGLIFFSARNPGSILLINWSIHGLSCLLLGLVLGTMKRKNV
jgi:hypothetical protein